MPHNLEFKFQGLALFSQRWRYLTAPVEIRSIEALTITETAEVVRSSAGNPTLQLVLRAIIYPQSATCARSIVSASRGAATAKGGLLACGPDGSRDELGVNRSRSAGNGHHEPFDP